MSRQKQLRKTRRGWESKGASKLSKAAVVVFAASAAMLGSAEAASGVTAEATATAVDSVTVDSGQAADAASRSFDIPSGTLADALTAYGTTTGLKIKSDLPADKMATFNTHGVRGSMTDARALHELLEGTGLSAHIEANGLVEIGVRNHEEVDVTTSVETANLTQFNEPLLDTAQTVMTVPQFIMQDEGVTTLRDTIRNVPGISIAAGEGGQQGDTLTIRGFNARNDIFLDGIRDFGSYYRDAFDYESVDVLEGPAGVEFGRGSTGGVVNQESKMPGLAEHASGTMQFGTNAMRRVTGDLNEPIQEWNGAAFRVNIVGEESNVAGRDYTNVRRFGMAPSLAVGLNGPTRAFITYLHEGENDLPDYGLPYFGVNPLNVRRNNYYGYIQGDYFKTNPDIVTGKVEHDFSSHLSASNALRFANYPRDVDITEPQINTVPIYTVNGVVTQTSATTAKLVSGTVTAQCLVTAATPCYSLNTPVSQLTVRRNQIQVNSVEDMLWDQATANAHFKAAGIANDALVIVEGGRERSRPQRLTFPSNIYTSAVNPNAMDIIPAATTLGAKSYINATSYGVGFLDTMKLLDWLLVSGGVRFDYFNTDYVVLPTATTAASHLSRLDKHPDYRAAVIAKPKPAGSIYFDWGTSFDPSAESLSLSATNAVEAPQYNETYEAGAKWDFFQDRLNLNGSWFQTTKTNVYEADPNNTANVIPVGNQRVRGAQVGGLGHLPQHFDVIFGYAYLNGITTNTEQNYSPFASVSAYVPGAATPETVQLYIPNDPVYGQAPYYYSAKGNPFANVPKNTANLFVTHSLWKGFIGGFGFNEVSARRASSTGPVALPVTNAVYNPTQLQTAFKVLPGYWVFNAMVKRPLTHHVDFQVNINNLTNAFFIDQPHPNHLIPSEGINAQFGFNYVWSGHHGE